MYKSKQEKSSLLDKLKEESNLDEIRDEDERFEEEMRVIESNEQASDYYFTDKLINRLKPSKYEFMELDFLLDRSPHLVKKRNS